MFTTGRYSMPYAHIITTDQSLWIADGGTNRIVKYDLNQPGIKWRIPYGDDPELAAKGITGTSMPGIQNSIIVTESGLVFGAGRDNFIRAWDSDTGKQLWSSRFGGNFTGVS